MSKKPTAAAPAAPPFTPVPLRQRHDGWTPEKQVDLIKALAISGCVVEACRAVNMSPTSAYALYNRGDAASLRQAWNAAIDQATVRLADAMIGRAIHGIADPIFYKGEQIGERRRFNDRLGMWLLKHRAPERYGAWRDRTEFRRDAPDAVARILQHTLKSLVKDVVARFSGRPTPPADFVRTERFVDDPEAERLQAEEDAAEQQRRRQLEHEAWEYRLEAIERGEIDPTAPQT